MKRESLDFDGISIDVITLNTVVVGSGAAGFNAALRLKKLGCEDIAIVTEGINMGTSRNTGSDKQTYYKLTLCGDCPDSPMEMAKDLFNGKCVDGDMALVEAALSAQCFLQLAELGVPFPVNRFGEYVGYKTDHDPRARATSAGPLTSKLMTERLEDAVKERNISIFDGYSVISVLTDQGRAVGLLSLCKHGLDEEDTRFLLFNCRNIIYTTGGPAGIYADSVYPFGHSGNSGVAFEAGVKGKNLTEWQYGLASVAPRWNVSGTYMQVLPRFVSVDKDENEHEFLADYFMEEAKCLSMIFQKGYEWPFDCRKVMNGSSIIDLLVYREQVLYGNRVYLDFRTNPYSKSQLDFTCLSEEALEYLSRAGACFGTPLDRLLHMNEPAYALYLSKGVDLKTEMLEISLCAQHHNGGLDVDMWWQTNIKGFYAAGEVAGSHGVYRPGGSALNAGQVGSLRAAQHITVHGTDAPLPLSSFQSIAKPFIQKHQNLCNSMNGTTDNVKDFMQKVQLRMSAVGGAVRQVKAIDDARHELQLEIQTFTEKIKVKSPSRLPLAYRLRDTLICQSVVLAAMSDYLKHGGKSRGSALYTHPNGNLAPGLEETFRFILDNHELDDQVQEMLYQNLNCSSEWRTVRNLPKNNDFFENVWREYRLDKNVR